MQAPFAANNWVHETYYLIKTEAKKSEVRENSFGYLLQEP